MGAVGLVALVATHPEKLRTVTLERRANTRYDSVMPDHALLLYLRNYVKENGYAPTVREIRETMGYGSLDTTHRRLTDLAEAGYIKRVGPRAIRIVQDA